MKSKAAKPLTQSEFAFFLVGFLLGAGFFKLPDILIDETQQDAWISATIALIYPLYIILMNLYIAKKYPKDNLISINKKIFGKFIGTLLNMIYLLQWPIICIIMVSDVISLSRIYFVAFLTPLKVVIVVTLVSLYASLKNLKALSKLHEFISYIAFIGILLSIFAISKGDILNIQPVFGAGLPKIIKGTILTSYYYIGFEVITLYHPYLVDEKSVKKGSLIAFLISSVVWIWITFISIYYLGIYFASNAIWSFVFIFESIRVPVINNFLYFFIAAWVLMSFKAIANYYFTTGFILEEITGIKQNKIQIILYPAILVLSMFLLNDAIKKPLIETLFPIYVIFNTLFFTILSIMIFIKNKSKDSANK